MADAAAVSWLSDKCRRCPERLFALAGDTACDYQELQTRVRSALAFIEKNGVREGDIAAFTGPAGIDFITIFFALAQKNAIAVPVAAPAAPETESKLAEAGAEKIFHRENDSWRMESRPPKEPPHPLVEELRGLKHPGLVLFSSGTTGKPKAMLHDLAVLLESYAARPPKDLRSLLFYPLDHIGGLDILLRSVANGSAVILPETSNPGEIAALIEKHRVNVLPASPTFFNLLLLAEAPQRYDLSSLEILPYGSEPMPEHLLGKLQKAFPNARLQQKFGTSETGALRVTSKNSGSLLLKFEDSGARHKIIDGELYLKTPSRILGYLNHPGENLLGGGWYRTGDLVEEAEGGFLKIIGRVNDVINVGGEKVLSAEVESVLLEMPEVADCRVYGEANALTGKAVACEIVPREEADPAAIRRAVRRHCRSRLPPFKVPARVTAVSRISIQNRFKKSRKDTLAGKE